MQPEELGTEMFIFRSSYFLLPYYASWHHVHVKWYVEKWMQKSYISFFVQ